MPLRTHAEVGQHVNMQFCSQGAWECPKHVASWSCRHCSWSHPVGSSSDFMVGQQVVTLPARAAGRLWLMASSSHTPSATFVQHPASRS